MVVVHFAGLSRHLILQTNCRSPNGFQRRGFSAFFKNWPTSSKGKSRGRSLILILTKELPALLRDNSVGIVENCLEQFEYVVADRIRRVHQMFSLYSRLWGEVALRQMINRIRRQFVAGGKEFLLGVAALSAFNWDDERIPDDEFEKHANELAICKKLKVELKGAKPKNGKADKKDESTCSCPTCGASTTGCCWDTFVENEDLSVWKMEEPNHKGSGLFCYKIFGRYEDVTADDFLSVFLDLAHRKEWDTHVVSLYVIDSEPSTNSDVIYWETKWPVLYSNRDYVYKRRYKIDRTNKLMTVLNKSTDHPSIPLYNNKTRITEYWSHMVIKPLTDFEKPGIEFSLTYFDNPGAALPTAITLWISATGMPEYLRNLRRAAMERGRERQMKERSGGEKSDGSEVGAPPPPSDPQPPPAPSVLPPDKPPERLAPLAAYVHWARSFL